MSVSEAVLEPAAKKPLAARSAPMSEKPTLIGLTREQMGDALREKGVADKQVRMRVSQLWHWLYIRGVSDFDAMTNVAKVMRAMLKDRKTVVKGKDVVVR